MMSPDGGIHLGQLEIDSTPVTRTLHSWSAQQPESPTRTANIRVRRSKYGSTLLQSPARAGHTARMQQIFEAARHGHQELQSNPAVLYPQLPNISRKAITMLDGSSDKNTMLLSKATSTPKNYRPESLCLSTNLLRAATSAGEERASGRSSGSWSDDSGYIVTNLRTRGHSFTTDERIHDWLRALSSPESQESQGVDELRPLVTDDHNPLAYTKNTGVSRIGSYQHRGLHEAKCLVISELSDPFVSDIEGQHITPALSSEVQGRGAKTFMQPKVAERPMSQISEQQRPKQLCGSYTQMPGSLLERSPSPSACVEKFENTPLRQQVLEEGGIPLSPLSPDVCIERGPSRYHNRKLQNDCNTRTPSRTRPTATFQAPRLKENDVLKELGSYKSDNSFTPHGSRTGSRFRRGQ